MIINVLCLFFCCWSVGWYCLIAFILLVAVGLVVQQLKKSYFDPLVCPTNGSTNRIYKRPTELAKNSLL